MFNLPYTTFDKSVKQHPGPMIIIIYLFIFVNICILQYIQHLYVQYKAKKKLKLATWSLIWALTSIVEIENLTHISPHTRTYQDSTW